MSNISIICTYLEEMKFPIVILVVVIITCCQAALQNVKYNAIPDKVKI